MGGIEEDRGRGINDVNTGLMHDILKKKKKSKKE